MKRELQRLPPSCEVLSYEEAGMNGFVRWDARSVEAGKPYPLPTFRGRNTKSRFMLEPFENAVVSAAYFVPPYRSHQSKILDGCKLPPSQVLAPVRQRFLQVRRRGPGQSSTPQYMSAQPSINAPYHATGQYRNPGPAAYNRGAGAGQGHGYGQGQGHGGPPAPRGGGHGGGYGGGYGPPPVHAQGYGGAPPGYRPPFRGAAPGGGVPGGGIPGGGVPGGAPPPQMYGQPYSQPRAPYGVAHPPAGGDVGYVAVVVVAEAGNERVMVARPPVAPCHSCL